MSMFASVAVFKREGQLQFKPPRKEPHGDQAQARKSAARYWSGNIASPDKLQKIVLVRTDGSLASIAERPTNASRDRPWIEFTRQISEAANDPVVAACLAELGVDPSTKPPPIPEELTINGALYRRVL